MRGWSGDRCELPHVATPQRSHRPPPQRTPTRSPNGVDPPNPVRGSHLPDGKCTARGHHEPPRTHPEDRMNPQLNYLIAKDRQIEFAKRAEQARLAGEARAAGTAPSRRWHLG